jgi:hypothetical protein
MPGADLTTLLLEVLRLRSARVSPAQVLARYQTDRFVAPGTVSLAALRRAEDAVLAALPDGFETLVLAPLVPLGTHAAVAPVDQNKVVATVRGTEVAADPTNALALEAAIRRRRSAEPVRLAASQRVVRAQRFGDPGMFAHFQLLGLATGGRDTGNLTFEREAAVEHVGVHVRALRDAGADRVLVEVTDLGGMSAVCEGIHEAVGVEVVDRPDREQGRGYYDGFCFKVLGVFGDQTLEIGDGGLVDWTQALVASRKERLLISGLGLERLALAVRRPVRAPGAS